MPYTITTESGSVYQFEDGRVTAVSAKLENLGVTFTREPLVNRFAGARVQMVQPEIGKQVIFYTRHGRTITSPVTEITRFTRPARRRFDDDTHVLNGMRWSVPR